MPAQPIITWVFHGYVTPAGNPTVQKWFNDLEDEEKDAVKDVLIYLRVSPRHWWTKPQFDSFDPDLSEIRITVNVLKRIYRVYGTFWPKSARYSYTFLIGKNKKVDNDRRGKREAIDRLRELRTGEASVKQFEF
jgi:hypothetical protein